MGELLGSGGMGDVYAAAHARLNRQFAIKLLHPTAAKNPDVLQRFHREALIASGLGHPHITQVVDFNSTADGSPYIVMELLRGEDLEARLERVRRVSVDNTLHVADQLGSALAAAHAQDVVHRDLKPQNIFVCPVEEDDWYVKILDFGISKIRGSTSIVTQDKTLIGTPQYMSPEQAEGHADLIDHRTDQFALATILYEMLTGVSPFASETVPGVLYRVVHAEPTPLAKLRKGIPVDICRAIERAMMKDHHARHPSIRAFVRALRGLSASVDTGVIPRDANATSALDAVSPPGAPTTEPFDAVSGTAALAAQSLVDGAPSGLSEAPAPVAPLERINTSLVAPLPAPTPVTPRSKLPWIVAGACASAAAVAVAMFLGAKNRTSNVNEMAKPTAAPVMTPPTRPAPPPTPVEITITIASTPTPDRILLDGLPITGQAATLLPDGKRHKLTIQKSGYTTEQLTFVADQSQVMRVQLRQSAKPATTRTRRRRARRSKPTKPTTTKPTKPTPTPKPGSGGFIITLP